MKMKNFDVYNYTFQNLQESSMTFEQVFDRIVSFMKKDPKGNFRLMMGTDSQVHATSTIFITGIVIQNEGNGVWSCIRMVTVPRKMKNLGERISYETGLTEEVASMLDENRKNQLIDIVLPHLYQGASFTLEGHLDIGAGKRNKTSEYVKDMTRRIRALGFEPKIKPDAFVASSYANRYTK